MGNCYQLDVHVHTCIHILPRFCLVCTGSHVANEVYQLVVTLIVLRLLSLNFPHKFQLDFSPKADILSLPTEHKTFVENAVELACVRNLVLLFSYHVCEYVIIASCHVIDSYIIVVS